MSWDVPAFLSVRVTTRITTLLRDPYAMDLYFNRYLVGARRHINRGKAHHSPNLQSQGTR